MNTREQLREAMLKALQAGNLAFADIAARCLLEGDPRDGTLWLALAYVASNIGAAEEARDYLARAQALPPHHAALARVRDAVGQMKPLRRGTPGYLVIRPWGNGFWSDVDHVLGQLLVAEMTGRTPIVCWGEGSRFVDAPAAGATWENGWEQFFEAVSAARREEIVGRGRSYFPPVFNDGNVAGPPRERFKGPYGRLASHYMLNRAEDVLVSEFHTGIESMRHWIPRGHALRGKPTYEIYRYLVRKYLRPKAELATRVDAYVREKFAGQFVIGVHVRGTDKLVEDPQLRQRHAQYPKFIEQALAGRAAAKIFLLTDSAPVVDEYRGRYGDRLITTVCARSSDEAAVHLTAQPSRRRIGEEVLIDTYVAARCDVFVGYAFSNVSCAVWVLRDWQPDTCTLIGPLSVIQTPNLFLYQPTSGG